MNAITQRIVNVITVVALAGSLAGCASIVSGGPAKVSVNSQPSGAKVTVLNKRTGETVDVRTTPTVLELKRGAGYFKGASYRLLIEKEGYRRAEIEVNNTINGWYFGNILIGGLIGMVVVDPLTGSMYTLEPKNIDRTLEAVGGMSTVDRASGDLVVTLLENVPADLVDSLIPVAGE